MTTGLTISITDELVAELEFDLEVAETAHQLEASVSRETLAALLAERAELIRDRERLDYLEAAYGGHTGRDGGFHVSLYLPDKDSLREMVDAAMQSEAKP